MLPALDVLKEYLGMMQEFPELVEIHRGAMRKVRDADKMKEEGRIDVRRERDTHTVHMKQLASFRVGLYSLRESVSCLQRCPKAGVCPRPGVS